ncbi:hypothetical protein Tco_0728710 [Tanacetum coccineum]|uniref:Uncharacterized protein n=1 Tax=Tanacetum coccineum TaxID=301880 RepID=A0ABQ4YLW0_9ASTR
MIQNRFITLSLEQFSRILRIPYIGQSVFTTEWGLDSLSAYQVPDGPCHTELPTPDDIHQYIKFERTDSNRLIKGQIVNLYSLSYPYQRVMEWYSDLKKGQYDIVDRVMRPPALIQEQKPRKDRGIEKDRHFTSSSSSSSFNHGSSSNQFDDDE